MKSARQHLDDSQMGYWTHMMHSFKQSNRLVGVAVRSYIHGILPWIYASDGPKSIYRIYREIRQMHHIKKIFDKLDNA